MSPFDKQFMSKRKWDWCKCASIHISARHWQKKSSSIILNPHKLARLPQSQWCGRCATQYSIQNTPLWWIWLRWTCSSWALYVMNADGFAFCMEVISNRLFIIWHAKVRKASNKIYSLGIWNREWTTENNHH